MAVNLKMDNIAFRPQKWQLIKILFFISIKADRLVWM